MPVADDQLLSLVIGSLTRATKQAEGLRYEWRALSTPGVRNHSGTHRPDVEWCRTRGRLSIGNVDPSKRSARGAPG